MVRRLLYKGFSWKIGGDYTFAINGENEPYYDFNSTTIRPSIYYQFFKDNKSKFFKPYVGAGASFIDYEIEVDSSGSSGPAFYVNYTGSLWAKMNNNISYNSGSAGYSMSTSDSATGYNLYTGFYFMEYFHCEYLYDSTETDENIELDGHFFRFGFTIPF